MRIISYMEAILTFAAPWDGVRPIAGIPFSLIANAIRARYGFQNVGLSPISQQVGLSTPLFTTGQFKFDDRDVALINQLDFQPAGFNISSSKTAFCEAFFEDLFDFLVSQFGFRKPGADAKRTHRTAIVCDFGFPIDRTFGKWLEVKKLFDQLTSPGEPKLAPLGMRFMGERNQQLVAETQFLFERRVISPPDENWIFSQGPFDTETHERLLSEIAEIFAD